MATLSPEQSTPASQITPIPEANDVPATQSSPDDINDDGRPKWDWETRWPRAAIRAIRIDAIYMGTVLIGTLVVLVLTWRGTMFEAIAAGCTSCARHRFDQFAYFFLGGLLGGTLFGVKYLYKVVARGFWNLDRRIWRIFSPFLSAGVALAVGTLIDCGVLGLTAKSSAATWYFSIGFVAGYFADSALGKMTEIAEVVFGAPHSRKHPPRGQSQNQNSTH